MHGCWGGMSGCQGGRAWLPGVTWLLGVCVRGCRGGAWLPGGGPCMAAGGAAWLPGGHAWLPGGCVAARGCAWLLGGMRGCQGGILVGHVTRMPPPVDRQTPVKT